MAAWCSRIATRARRARRRSRACSTTSISSTPVSGSGRLAGAAGADRNRRQRNLSARVAGRPKVAFISERDSEDDLDLWWMPVPPAAIAKPMPLGARPPKPVSSSVQSAGTDGKPLRANRITRVRGHEAYPSWAPDNSRVAFYAVREGIGSVWVATAEPPRPEPTEDPHAARQARRAAAAGVAPGRRAGVVAGWQDAARHGPARSGARLQRQSASQRSRSAAAVCA